MSAWRRSTQFMAKQKLTNTKDLAREILAPLIKHCAEKRGAMTEVMNLFNKGNASPVNLTTIRRWVTNDETAWNEPLGGSLLRLLGVWRELRGKDVVNALPDQTIECAANGCEPSRDGLKCKRCSRPL